jgi:tetratricopeptide (TPR) repeat protein
MVSWLALACAGASEPTPLARAQQAYAQCQSFYRDHPQDIKAAWQFGRTCFDLADFATNKAQRADLAQQGIAACRKALATDTNSAPAHYYLGLDMGQLAQTRTLGALRLVNEMEREFLEACRLDPQFDYGGPDRALGLLYRDAPSFGSIGSRTKARQHLLRAVELAPDDPENRLNLLETYLKWNERKEARVQLNALENGLASARAKFSGPAWASSWADWDNRIEAARKALGEPARLETPRH